MLILSIQWYKCAQDRGEEREAVILKEKERAGEFVSPNLRMNLLQDGWLHKTYILQTQKWLLRSSGREKEKKGEKEKKKDSAARLNLCKRKRAKLTGESVFYLLFLFSSCQLIFSVQQLSECHHNKYVLLECIERTGQRLRERGEM